MSRPTGHTLNLEAVRSRVDALGLSHGALADRLGITRQGATNILSGGQRVSGDRARRLAVALELPEECYEDLLAGGEDLEATDPSEVAYQAGAGRRADSQELHRLQEARTVAAHLLETSQALEELILEVIPGQRVSQGHRIRNHARTATSQLQGLVDLLTEAAEEVAQ